MRLRVEMKPLVKCDDILQDAYATTRWLLGRDIDGRLSVDEIIVQVLEVIIH